jgi:pectate lyase
VCPAAEPSDPNQSTKYLDAVREFADNVLKYGRDTHGPKHTPLFVDGLNVHTREPVEWITPKGEKWVLSNFASQQNLLRTLDGLSKVTEDQKYRKAAEEAVRYANKNLQSPSGLFYWGGHTAYDLQADKPCGRKVHELKGFYPYYELMWEVDPIATRRFIESSWAGHILNWSSLSMNRHYYEMSEPLKTSWDYKYDPAPLFKGGGFSPSSTGGDLYYAGAWLTKFTGDMKPLIWAKRLAYRYVETRHPNTGISARVFTGTGVRSNDGVLSKLTPVPYTFPWQGHAKRSLWESHFGYDTPSPGTMMNRVTAPWICQLMLGELLGSDGKDFIQWSLEELTAWGKVAYRKEDNTFVPRCYDGTVVEGYVCKEDSPLGLKGSKLEAVPLKITEFWAYALAYCLTKDVFMWEMTRNIALANDCGDLGATVDDRLKLNFQTDLSDPYAMVVFLELYHRIGKVAFLKMAQRIGDNILAHRFYKGFVSPDGQHTFTKLDAVDPLALIHLHAALIRDKSVKLPKVWPGTSFFEEPYRSKDAVDDNQLIYSLKGVSEPPRSLQEAVAEGDLEAVKSMIAQGAKVDGREDGFRKTALHRAAIAGNTDIAKLLIDAGARLDSKTGGSTALHYAVEYRHEDMVRLLLDHGADVSVRDQWGQGSTPLMKARRSKDKEIVDLLQAKLTETSIHWAARQGVLAKVEEFLEDGIDVNAKDSQGMTPLLLAVQRGHKDIIDLLIAKKADVNVKNETGQTPLDLAVRQNNKDIVELLIANDADIDAKNDEGQTPLDIAISQNRSEVVKLLAAKGADISFHSAARIGDLAIVENIIRKGTDLNAKDVSGRTPLHYAVEYGHKNIVELLITKGANVNIKDDDGNTPGHVALGKYNNTILELLIAKGVNIVSIHLSAYQGDLDEVRSYIEEGSDVNAMDFYGTTSLHYAARRGHREVGKFLIAKGADVNAKDKHNYTPLHRAAGGGHKDVAILLIDNGATINARARWDYTPMFYAAWSGIIEVVELLVEKGADMNAKDKWGWTPLHYMAENNRRYMAEFLVAKGADVNAEDNGGRTPLQVAKENSRTEIIELLQKHMLVHDVAITDVSVPSSCNRGDIVPVEVSVANQGVCKEAFRVILTDHTYGEEIASEEVTLAKGWKDRSEDDADLIFDSPASGKQHFGYPVVCGDVNGDGYEDLLTTAGQWNNAQGRAYLHYGGKNMDTIPDKIFAGEAAGDLFGDGGAALGDVNGDHYDDVLVGAPGHKGGAEDGRVYIYYGSPDMDDNADLILEGESEEAGYFGVVIVTGDLNNDGYGDVVVSANKYKSYKGRVYLYYGGEAMDNICDVTFDGENANDMFGRKAAIGGDVNGDGYPDLILGARRYPGGQEKGRAYLFYGGNPMDNIRDKTFTGVSNKDTFGEAVALFDIDDNGFADVVIGAWGYNAGSRQGRVYLYWGEADIDATVADKTFTGKPGEAKACFGSFIWGGYVNNDNYGDLLIAGFGYHNGDARGQAYIYYGGTNTSMDEAANHTFTGESPGSQPNRVTLGDVNNDGYDDAIIGGYNYNGGQGRVWLYYGNSNDSTQLKFDWDTTNACLGKHTLKASIAPVAREEDVADNTMTLEVEVKERPESMSKE